MNGKSSESDLTLVIDQGGHATRCIVFDASGGVVSEVEKEIGTQRPSADRVEHDAAEVAMSVTECLARTSAAMGDDTRRVASAAMCTQRSSIACWSRKNGQPLSPVLSWQDTRAKAYLDSLPLDDSELRSVTGLVRSPHYGASKMRWCLDELPPVSAAAESGDLAMGPLSSFLVYALSDGNAFACDPANGSRTLLYDLDSRDWSPRLLDLFGIDACLLPTLRASRSSWLKLGLGSQAPPLSVVTGDQSAVPWAFSRDPVGLCCLNMGTGAFLQCPVRDRVIVPGLLNSVIPGPGYDTAYSVEGTVNGAGAALSWLATKEGTTEDVILSAIPTWMDEVESPPLFINTVGGIGSPFWAAGGPPRFTSEAPRAARAVAVVESVAFLVCRNVAVMRSAGIVINEIVASGGLSALGPMLQLIAQLSGLTVWRSAYPEATAYGGARLCRPALPLLTRNEAHVPAERNRAGLERRYAEWLDLMDAA